MFSGDNDQDFLDSLFSGRRSYSEDQVKPHNLPVLKSTLADRIRVKVKYGKRKKKKKLIITSTSNKVDDYNDESYYRSKFRANSDHNDIDYGYESNKQSNTHQSNQFIRSTHNDSNHQSVSNHHTPKNDKTNLGYISNFLRSVKGDPYSNQEEYPESDIDGRNTSDYEIRNNRGNENEPYNDYNIKYKDNKRHNYDKDNNDYNRSSNQIFSTNNINHIDKSNILSFHDSANMTNIQTGDNQIDIRLFMEAWKETWILQIRVRGMLSIRDLQIKRKV
jgi:hypothetical protein